MIGRFREALEGDFKVVYGEDLNALWQQRQFRKLSDRIKQLPQNSNYADALAKDEDYARELVKMNAPLPKGDGGPPMTSWSAEVDMLARAVDSINALRITMIAANLPKGKTPPKMEPVKRPVRAIDKMKNEARQKKHEALKALVLPESGEPSMADTTGVHDITTNLRL